MRFPYFILPGDLMGTPRPLVPVKYKYKNKETKPILTLIDSGADYSFLTFKIASYLGINFKRIKPRQIAGFNGSCMDCYPYKTTIDISGKTMTFQIYYGGSLTDEYPCILGQDVFFDRAKIVFERYDWSFSIDLVD